VKGEFKEYEMGGACNTHGRDERQAKFWSENLKGKDHSEDLGVDGKYKRS
jgi:hypothetical protein